MANKKCGKQSFRLTQPPVITAWASVAGKKEANGPLRDSFDITEKSLWKWLRDYIRT